jgi:RNA polymerase sigma factor (sigma-70 family)
MVRILPVEQNDVSSTATRQALDPPEPQSQELILPDWADLVERIRCGEDGALGELYDVFGKGVRYFLLRHLGGEDIDDRVHDCFLIVAEAICNGELRDPSRLMGYVRTVVKRQVASSIDDAVARRRTLVGYEDALLTASDWRSNPEASLLSRQRTEIARRVLKGISRRDREILYRFYVDEQPQEQICDEMGLSYNQFRLLKSRAKKRFGELGRRLTRAGFAAQNSGPKKT